MRKIYNLNKQQIILQGFGEIEISENHDGKWIVDLFPRGSENTRENILIETTFSPNGSKYFENPIENKNRIDEIYN